MEVIVVLDWLNSVLGLAVESLASSRTAAHLVPRTCRLLTLLSLAERKYRQAIQPS